ncbi:enoyl-CoA hydratase/isomerase family protein, partial [Nocardia cyriacigeorgica]|uniref:enoyl-CoA hydratase/isomerase family protein n=1 Tax=Nocardia cyriacigeorgica TaxID=135487 RepID=UPI00245522EB
MSSELLVDVSAGIAVLTLNRPAQQNAFTPAMIAELSAALQRCDIEDAIRVVVITGTPPPVCAGAGEQLVETGGAVDLGAQHQGVDEHADQVVQRGFTTAGDRGA